MGLAMRELVSHFLLTSTTFPILTKKMSSLKNSIMIEVDGLIQQTYTDRPSMLKNFGQLVFHSPEKLSAEFNIWNLSLGLAASAHATIHCAAALRDADLRKDFGS